MSAVEFYLSKGYTSLVKSVVISGLNTMSVWGPTSGNRVVLTGMSVSANTPGTIAFYFEGNSKIAEFCMAGSSTISPYIGAIESTMVDGKIFAKLGSSATDGCSVNLQGFEI